MAQKRPDRWLGPNHDTFWEWCGKGELRLQRCGDCGKLSWPVVKACEFCGSEKLQWERMSGRGKIVAWCTFERDYYRGLLPVPWDTILVELEEGPLFMSNPEGFTWQDITVGMDVELTFIECEDSAGTYMLPVFRLPVNAG
ncbi:MAG: OB-fold domain-containing protein [Novosphingobium sp.]|nr:OB-fold domain-containing protein [Novosphingobium sp.]